MKDKIAAVLKIVGVVAVLLAVTYDLFFKDANSGIYWAGLIVGIVFILAGRITGSIGNGGDDNEENH